MKTYLWRYTFAPTCSLSDYWNFLPIVFLIFALHASIHPYPFLYIVIWVQYKITKNRNTQNTLYQSLLMFRVLCVRVCYDLVTMRCFQWFGYNGIVFWWYGCNVLLFVMIWMQCVHVLMIRVPCVCVWVICVLCVRDFNYLDANNNIQKRIWMNGGM
jgi:hypothetical protein